MDILKRKLLNVGDVCYFYVSSVEEPYIYIRFKGVIEEVHKVTKEQVIYRTRGVEILETDEKCRQYINRNSYRGYDLITKKNKIKSLYYFDCENSDDFFKLYDKFYFECSSAITFDNKNEMENEFKKINTYIIELLNETIKKVKGVI